MSLARFVDLDEVDGQTCSVNINHIVLVRDHENPDMAWVRLGGSDFPLEVVGSRELVLALIERTAKFG